MSTRCCRVFRRVDCYFFLRKRITARLFLNFLHNLTFEILIDKSDSRFAVLYIC